MTDDDPTTIDGTDIENYDSIAQAMADDLAPMLDAAKDEAIEQGPDDIEDEADLLDEWKTGDTVTIEVDRGDLFPILSGLEAIFTSSRHPLKVVETMQIAHELVTQADDAFDTQVHDMMDDGDTYADVIGIGREHAQEHPDVRGTGDGHGGNLGHPAELDLSDPEDVARLLAQGFPSQQDDDEDDEDDDGNPDVMFA